jgi:hypothetical protein
MAFMNEYTKRLNINVKPDTYKKLKKMAYEEGRKAGNMARRILEAWANEKKLS